MVLPGLMPLQPGQRISGSVPPECADGMKRIKWGVLLLIATSCTRMIFGIQQVHDNIVRNQERMKSMESQVPPGTPPGYSGVPPDHGGHGKGVAPNSSQGALESDSNTAEQGSDAEPVYGQPSPPGQYSSQPGYAQSNPASQGQQRYGNQQGRPGFGYNNGYGSGYNSGYYHREHGSRVRGGEDLFSFINMFILIVLGVLVCKDEDYLKGFYQCLSNSICQQCAESDLTGVHCLYPFLMCTVIHLIFDVIFKTVELDPGTPYGLSLLCSYVAQGCSIYYAYAVYKQVLEMHPEPRADDLDFGPGGFGGLGGGGFGSGLNFGLPGNLGQGRPNLGGRPSAQAQYGPVNNPANLGGERGRPPSGATPGPTANRPTGFQAFQGQGNRLGA